MSYYIIVRPWKEVTTCKPLKDLREGSWLKPDKLVTKAESRSLTCLAEANCLPEGPSNGLVTNLSSLSV